jgi:protein-disulfide isomerase
VNDGVASLASTEPEFPMDATTPPHRLPEIARRPRNAAAALALALCACGGTGTSPPSGAVATGTFETRLADLATRAGVQDLAAWQACRASPAAEARVIADMTLGVSSGVGGTPTFFVNGTPVVGAQASSVFRAAIDAARTSARASGIDAADYYATVVPAIPVGASPVSGPAEAWVTVVVFSDFECPFCAAAQQTLAALLPGYGADVRLVFKHFPLSMHAHARATAIAAECAAAQGAFWAFHDLVFSDPSGLFGTP